MISTRKYFLHNLRQRGKLLSLRWLRKFAVPLTTLHAVSLGGWFGWGGQDANKDGSTKGSGANMDSQLIAEADRLYDENKIPELYECLISHRDSSNDEVLWRLARAAVDLGKHIGEDKTKREKYYEAFEYIKRALELNDKNFAVHKWYAILLDYTGEYEGRKQRIKNSFEVRKHFERAIELNPKDATSVHSLGYWCFVFAGLTWYERKLASAFFATPPTATFEEALEFFLKAEETEPNFYSMNLLMIGKTYLRLQDAHNAYQYLVRCKEYPVKTPDDKQANEEATHLIHMLLKSRPKKDV